MAKLQESFSQEGFTRRKGIISVVRAPSWCDKALILSEEIFKDIPVPLECASLLKQVEIDADGKVLVPAFAVVDGLHRHTACINQVHEGPQVGHFSSYLYFKVDLWRRKDKKEITNCEILSLGSFLNRNNDVVAIPSFADNVHLCISFFFQGNTSRQPRKEIYCVHCRTQVYRARPAGKKVKGNAYAICANRNDLPPLSGGVRAFSLPSE